MAKDIMAHHGQKFDAYYSVIMPDTWTPVFDLTNKNRVDKWLSEGKKQLKLVIDNIISKRKGDFIERKLPRWVAAIPAAYMYETERKTKNLSVNKDICIGCGICAKKCPVWAIQIEEGYPVWKSQMHIYSRKIIIQLLLMKSIPELLTKVLANPERRKILFAVYHL